MLAPTPPEIALFYDGYELKAEEGLLGTAYSNGRRALRFSYRTLRQRQVHTGFYTAFRGLVSSLRSRGVKVRINDFGYARDHPLEPVGLAGYPSVLSKVNLPNPVIFGPGDYGSGEAANRLAHDPKVKFLTQPSQWAVELNRPWSGGKGRVYFAGIDTEVWSDLSKHEKKFDFLVYDKMKWHRPEKDITVLGACVRRLEERGLSYCTLKYGEHHISKFRTALSQARGLLFLSEHETQGLAYQEAMSSGVPILAWDDGILVDPTAIPTAPASLKVSSVPYFDPRCGVRFKTGDFNRALDEFLAKRDGFAPRQYVEEELSLERSADTYLALYHAAKDAID